MRIRKAMDNTAASTQNLAQISDALAHPARIAILKYVAQKNAVRNDVCNSDLVEFLNYSQATISQHVKKLVKANLLQREKQDKFTMYSINREQLQAYISQLQEI